MININKLEDIISDQSSAFRSKDIGVIRDINFQKYLRTNQITAISGIRRSGKSTLLAQFSRKIKQFYYISFDDERLLGFEVSDFQNLMLAFRKTHQAQTIFLDEIQNVPKWERFVRRIYDEGYKVFITGSNAKLLGSELATHLTGRYFKIDLYPFSFKEFLMFKKKDFQMKGTIAQADILKNFDYYLKQGGFPEFVKHQDSEFVKRIYEDVIYKDLLVRFQIKDTKNFKQLANYLFANFTQEISYHSLKNTLNFKSATSVKNYLEFMQESYLIFELYKYDYSLKKQYVSDKKVYVIDNGMRNTVAFSFSEDKGKMLENLIFIELKRRGQEIYYYKDKKECDFIIKEKNKITSAVQATLALTKENKKREIEGLLEAMDEFKLKQGLILTLNEEDIIKIDKKKLIIKPVYKWLIGTDV
ncbi:ATP-binding protein [Patescibacteria group bacterium]|nr:ATP-binding protein [Patescibacteria group bacterium]MBU4512740.1 ATP-binding protein [Patescibacteria group bacterium]MCG2693080.1 ATP-binding protein [Candidatus Parcubacteria bacterium]